MVARFRPIGADAERIEFAKKLTKLLREKEMNQSEPAVYMTGKWGIEIEDSVHVTKDGWEYLTEPAPAELPIV
jgi:Xaa-Pro aminopeptidase